MNFQRILIPVGGVVLVAAAYRSFGWQGVAIATGALAMWLLLHFNRVIRVLKRAADHPVGHVGSAVMLNAKLKPRMALLHVVAMTRALGSLQSPKDSQPELYRWTDGTQSHVTCEFRDGKLKSWTLVRPQQGDEAPADGAAGPAP
ncbi:MAG: glycerate kinase [Rhodoferax sp.]